MILVSPRDDAQRDEGQPLSEPERLALLDKALQVAAELKGINPLRLYRHARTTDALFCRLQAGTSKLQAPLFHTRSRDLKTVEDSFLTSLADILDSGPPSTAREDNLSRSVFDLIHHFRDLQVTPQNEAFLMNGLLDALVECAECAVCFDGESDCVFQCGCVHGQASRVVT